MRKATVDSDTSNTTHVQPERTRALKCYESPLQSITLPRWAAVSAYLLRMIIGFWVTTVAMTTGACTRTAAAI